MSRGQEVGRGHPLARPSDHPQPLFCSTAAAQAGRVAYAMNASPTMAVVMAPAAPPGNVPVMRAGEAYSVTKVSQGKERMQRGWERWLRSGNQSYHLDPNLLTTELAFSIILRGAWDFIMMFTTGLE